MPDPVPYSLTGVGYDRGTRRSAIMRKQVCAVLMLSVAMASGGCKGRELMPTPNLYVESETDPFADVPPVYRTSSVELLYLTDREPEEARDGSLEYGYGRSASGAFGTCVVEIGKDVSWDTLVENSRAKKRTVSLPLKLGNISELGRLPGTPFPLEEVDGKLVDDREVLAQAREAAGRLQGELQRRLDLTPRKEAFIFVHGYHNTFEDAAFTLAEMWHFMGREGVPVLYTWPAGHSGLIRGYNYDRESGQFTIYHLKQLLRALSATPGLDAIHVIAHSRGTDVSSTAIRELLIEARGGGRELRNVAKIRNLILAAPDIDFEVGLQRFAAERFFKAADRITIYVSEGDKAIGISGWLFDSFRRIGQLRYEDLPADEKDILMKAQRTDIIDARVKSGSWGHDYFHSNPAVSSDVILLLRYGRGPGADHGRPLDKPEGGIWTITRDYSQFTDE
jgi:esterase/lipase superfamily enzyme